MLTQLLALATLAGAMNAPAPSMSGLATVNGIAFEDDRTAYVTTFAPPATPGGRRRAAIGVARLGPEGWSAPVPWPFIGAYDDYQPTLSPDGGRLFFTSTRPSPAGGAERRQDVWMSVRGPGGWDEPQAVPGLAAPGWDGHAMLTRSGRLYFASDRPGGAGAVDIYVADLSPGGVATGVRNVAELNSPDTDNDLYVDPDERFIVFARYSEVTKDIDLFYALPQGDGWSSPQPVASANSAEWDMSPTVSADGNWLVFVQAGKVRSLELRKAVPAATIGGRHSVITEQ